MEKFQIICYGLTLIILIISAIFDAKKGIIPNYITLPFIPIGLLINGLNNVNIFPAVITIIILFVISFFRIFGFGDIKLFMSVCALSGVGTMLFMIGIGAAASFIYYYFIDPFRIKKATAEGISTLISFDRNKFKSIINSGNKIHFAPFLLIGFIISLLIFVRW